MPNITSALNQHIRQLARRELKGSIVEANKRSAEHRRSIAALKREVTTLRRELATLKKFAPKAPEMPKADLGKARLRIDGLKAHRTRLGLSANDYGKLIGVSGLTIYNWESKKSKPRRSQLGGIVAVRGIGKREAMKRLSERK
jgi:DNA-binding transcriptional regulator YiaG